MTTPLRFIQFFCLSFLMLGAFVTASGQVSVSGGTGGSTLCVGGGYVTLSPIVINESANGDISMPTLSLQTLNLTLSGASYEFEPNVGSVSFTGVGAASILPSINVTATQISVSLAEGDDVNSTGLNTITITGIRVRATAAAVAANLRRPAVGGGTITINGFAAGSNVSSVQGFAAPTANAGSDAIICQNTVFNFATQSTPASASAGTNLSWNHSGLGILTNQTTLTPTYTPAPAETGVVTFTLSATNTNGSCSAATDQMQITINPSTAIVTPPSASVICENTNTAFSVSATGTGLTYQWLENGSNISNGVVYGGATTPTLSLTNVPNTFDGRNYSVRVSGTCGIITTSPTVVLNVNRTPHVVPGNPASQVICQNDDVDFVVDAGATTGVSYQWEISTNGGVSYSNLVNGGQYAGVTSGILNLTNVPTTFNNNLYRAVISGICTPPATSNAALLTVNADAAITTTPTAQVVCEDGVATFTVVGTGTGVTYQWYEDAAPITNGGIYAGATSATLTLTGVTTTLSGNNYHVVLTNACTTATHTAVPLTVNRKPVISVQPNTSSTVCQGTSTSFSVDASLTTSPTYQWQVSTNGGVSFTNLSNGGNYANVTTSTLNLSTVPLGFNNNLYRVMVSGTCTPSVASNAALLRVNTTTAITTQPTNQAACEDGTAIFNVTATGTALTYQWRENGAPIVNGGVYSGATTATLTLAGVTSAFDARAYTVVITGACGPLTSASRSLTINEKPEVSDQPDNVGICEGAVTSFTVVASPTTNPTYQWQVSVNGGLSYANLSNGVNYSNVTASTLNLTGTPLSFNNNLYRVIVSGTCSPSATSDGALLTVNANPVITTVPTTQVACEDGVATFTVAATGSGLTYQWRQNGTPIANGGIYSGATTSTLTLSGVTSALNGNNYSVLITNACSTATSTPVPLTINEKPEVSDQPDNVGICEGAVTSFTVVASPTTSPTYQWQVSVNGGLSYANLSNGVNYSNVTASTLNLTGTPLSFNNNLYRVIVSGTCSPSATSDGALLTVNANPVITTVPTTQVACEDGVATFTVAATGSGLTYQWRQNGTPIANGGIYSGATTSTLTLTGVTSALNGNNYSVLITNACSTATSTPVPLTINEKPEVSDQPDNVGICEGAVTSFTVVASPTTNPTYQWQVSVNGGLSYANLSNGVNYSNVTASTLNLTGTPLSFNNNLYRVIVSGTCSPSATSDGALLTVNANPVITTVPTTQVACEDGVATFTVAATGSGLTYQWRQNGTPIANGGIYSGATTSTLTLTGVTSALNGNNYSVLITNACSTATSTPVPLTINEKPEVSDQPDNVGICEGAVTSFTVVASPTTSPTYQWQVSVNGGLSYANLSNGVNYSNVTASTLNLTGTPLSFNNNLYRVIVSGTCSPSATSDGALLTVNANPVITTVPTTQVACEDGVATFTVAATGSGLTYQWRQNGTPIANGGIYSGATTSTLTLSGVTSALNGNNYSVLITNACSTATSTPVPLTINEKPEVSDQPDNVGICEGAVTSFTVVASPTTNPTYQWQVSVNGGLSYANLSNGVNYSNVTASTLNLTGTPLSFNNNLYRVIVSGTCSPSATSDGALLTVNANPVITTVPTTQVACEDGVATFTVAATGSGLTYQWRQNGTPIANGGIYSGATTSTLTLTGVTSALNGNNYSVLITNACSTATSTPVPLTINEKPEVSDQPDNVGICEGAVTSFTVVASPTTSPTYQWQVSVNGGLSYANLSNGVNYSNVTASTLNLTGTPLSFNNNLYRVIVSGTCSPSATSDGALLTVNANPVITTVPTTQVACEDGVATFTVAATGSGLTYQWRQNGTPIANGGIYSGATTSTLTLTGVTSALNGNNYSVLITNACSTATSTPVPLTINEKPEVSDQPDNVGICEGAVTSFTVVASPTTNPTYQWQVSVNGGLSYANLSNGVNYSNVTASTLNLTGTPLSFNNNLYRVIVSGTCSPSATSDGALLTVNANPVITTVPTTQVACEDGVATFTVAATGSGLTYQWRQNGTPIANGGIYSGATTSTLTLTGVTSALNGNNYSVLITNACSTATSTPVPLTINEKPEVSDQPDNVGICEGAVTSFTVVASPTTSPTYQWQVSVNGGLSYANLSNGVNYSNVTASTLNLTGTPLSFNNNLYRVIVSGTCSPSATSDGALLTVNANPVITTVPTTQVACEDGVATFTVAATGSGLTYQWRQNGTPIANGGIYSGATTSTLTLSGVTSALNGNNYSVLITNACSTATSTPVPLTINEKPEVSDQPDNVGICEGAVTSFTVVASPTTNPTYQWQVSVNGGLSYANLSNGVNYSNVTASTLNLTGTPLSFNNNLYRVIVSGTCSPSATSDGALLTVNANPVITTVPTTQVACEDGVATFTVAATGSGLTYQWRQNGTPIANGGIYSGATTSTLTLSGVTSALNGNNYSVLITNACSTATSTPVPLTINEKPEVSDQPDNVGICEGAVTSFTVVASPTTSPTYQWQVSVNGGLSYANLSNGVNYSNVTASTLNLTGTPLSFNNNLYRVIVSGTCSPSATSDGALLTVGQEVVINTDVQNSTICENGNTQFSVAVLGAGLTYQWFENGIAIVNGGVYAGAGTATLTLTNVPASFTGNQYNVNISGTCSNEISAFGTLTVDRTPDAFATDAEICSGQATNIVISNPNAVSGTTFTWTIQNAANVTGASAGTGALIAQTLSAADGVNIGTVTYIIQPVAAGCNGTPFAVSVTVKPIPNVSASSQIICAGESSNILISNPNGVAGTSFTWIVQSVSNVTGALPGSGSVISQILTASDGISQGNVVYRITPTAGGCQGGTVDVIVTVNPVPVINNPATDFIQEICSGVALNFVPSTLVSGTTYTWTSTVIGTLSGVSASGSGPITDTPVNALSTDAVIIYTIKPALTGCQGTPVNLVVTVNPVPSATASDQSICSGQSTSIAITPSPKNVGSTSFSWTILSSNNAGGFAVGSGNSISQLLTSTDQLTDGTVVYRITPRADNCDGPEIDVTATIKAVPVINNPVPTLAQQICSTVPLNFVPTTVMSGSTFTWTSSISGTINPATVTASGSGPITDSPSNTGSIAGTVTYHITPHNNGCDGPAVDFIVTVKPVPTASATGVVICSGETAVINIDPSPENVANTTFSWSAAPSINVNGSSGGSGTLISQILSTTNNSVGSVAYTITPASNGCNGLPITVTVTVNPFATVSAGLDKQVCQDQVAPVSIPVSGTIGGSATSGIWFVKSGLGTISPSLTSSGTVTATYNTQAGDIGGFVELYLVTNDPDGAGGPCTIKADTVRISLNPMAKIVPLVDQVVCDPGVINLSGTLTGSATSGSWSPETTGGGSLTISSITGNVVTANYTTVNADVPGVVSFRLTSNDPDGSGPCSSATDVVSLTINESAGVFAGLDFAVCEDSVFQLHGDYDKATTSITWSGGSGASRFSNVADTASTYSITPADISAGFVTLTLTSNDPDGVGGPCSTVSDNVVVTINKLPNVFFFGLEDFYAENSPIDNLSPVPTGGIFEGPGIIAGTYSFKPSSAGSGPVTITYKYEDPETGCRNSVSDNTIVNPVTLVDFYIENNRLDNAGNPLICSNQGAVKLIGVPPSNDDLHLDPTLFKALSPELIPRMTENNEEWTLDTDNLPAGTYLMQYIYTNQYNATDTITRDIHVFAAPTSKIDVTNDCIDKLVVFSESSYFDLSQNNLNGDIIEWDWTYGEGTNGSSDTTRQPEYQYITPGLKIVTLTVITDEGCSHKTSKVITIGTPPTPDFETSGICLGDLKEFTDLSTSEFGSITQHSWDFGDGDTLGLASSNKPIPPGQHGGNTSGIWKDPKHNYTEFQVYNVTLTVSTDSKCKASTSKDVFILQTPVSSSDYFTNFDDGPGTWVAVGEPVTQSSWQFSMPDGEFIKKKYATDSAWVTSGNDGTYFNGEQSFVYGPCLNLTQIDRPMVSLNYQVDTKVGFDGAVLQYSVNSGQTWRTVGNAVPEEGINWYNRTDVVGNPGGDDNYAWSATGETAWKNARFNLDQIPMVDRDTVVFRIAFGSSLDASPGRKLNGFAFDDVYIGSKKRKVLLEHFTNDNVFNSEDMFIDETLPQENFIKLQYHLSIPSADQINQDNPFDHLARAIFYNVARPPATLVDGILGPYYGTNFDGLLAKVTSEVLDRRSLEDPAFDISIVFNDTIDTYLSADITYTFIDTVNSYTQPVILQAALVESGTGVNGNRNSLRKLLHDRGGFVINTPLTAGTPASFVRKVRQPINFPITYGDSLSVIAFAQELTSQNVKEVLQAVIAKAPKVTQEPLVATEKDLEANRIEIYPNPASMFINFAASETLRYAYSYRLIDQRGVTVLQGDLDRDLRLPQAVDISKLANGMYFMAIVDKNSVLRYEKIAVMNKY